MLPTSKIAAKKKVKKALLFWFIITGELLIFLAAMFYLQKNDNQALISSNTVLIRYIVYAIVIALLPAIFRIYDRAKQKAITSNSFEEKAALYLKSKIIMFVLAEFAALAILILQYISPEKSQLYAFGIVLVACLLIKPGERQFLKDFSIS